MRYKVMKTAGALPTEQRVRDMNDHQYLWYYFNILKDEEETAINEELAWKRRLDYVGWWVNPKLAKEVMELEKRKAQGDVDPNDNVERDVDNISPGSHKINDNEMLYVGDKTISDSFEDELKAALRDQGIDDTEFVELPDSHNAGNKFESQNDFLNRALAMQSSIETETNDKEQELKELIKAGMNLEEIDYFEYDGDE